MSLGKTSAVISLPKKWLETSGLEKGDLVNLEELMNGALIVTPVKSESAKQHEIQIKVELNDDGGSVMRRIVACSLDGYDRITLVSRVFSPEQQQAIRSISSMLYMMVEESEAGKVVLRSIIDESKTSIISCVERMYAITSSMCRDTLRSVSEQNIELAKSVVAIEKDVDQLEFLVYRLIRVAISSISKHDFTYLDYLDYQTLVHRIDRVADQVETIASNVAEVFNKSNSLNNSTYSLMKTVFDIYNQALAGFLSADISKVDEVINNKKKAESDIKDLYSELALLNSLDGSVFISQMIIINSLRNIAHYSSDIAELTIDQKYNPRSIMP
jgi:phosphate uptake regulator